MAQASCLQLLEACLSHELNQRQPAETALSQLLQQNPQNVLSELLQIIHSSQRDDIRQIGSIYIRRTLKSNTQLFIGLDIQFQQMFKEGLLTLVGENVLKLRMKRKICDIIEILAMQLLPINQWNTLLASIEQLLHSNDMDVTISGLYLLGLVVNACPKAIDQNAIQSILQLLCSRLTSENESVRIETMKSLSRVVFVTEDVSCCESAVPSMFQLLSTQDETNIQTVLECLTEICKDHGDLFKNCINHVESCLAQIASQPNIEEDTKSLALEFLVTLAESEPHLIRRNNNYITSAIDIALRMMVSIEHNHESWNSDYHDAEEQMFDMASCSLTRLFEAIGAPKFTGPCMSRIDQFLKPENDWNLKYAGLCAMYQVMEALKKKRVRTGEILGKIKYFVQDPHPRVQYATISCMAIMCTDFGSKFVNRNAEIILESFFLGINDSNNPRLQAHGTKCLVNFCDKASKKCFMKHLDAIIQTLFNLANTCQVSFVQESLCSAMAEIANTAKGKYCQYYPVFSQYLLTMLQSNVVDTLKLEGFRCLSYIGRAVGVDIFAADAGTAMALSQNLIKQDADVLELISCWGRVAEVLGDQFQPYIEAVAEEAAKYAIQDCELRNYDSDDASDSTKLVQCGDSYVPVDANRLEEKEAGLILLGKLAMFCPGCFAPLLEQAIGIAMPLLSYPLHRSIRSASLDAISGFTHCAVANFQNQSETRTFFLNTLQTLCQRLSEEPEMSVLSLVAHTINQILSKNQQFTANVLGENEVGTVVRSLIACVRAMNERINQRQMIMAAPDLDDEDRDDFEKENQDEVIVSQDITDAINALLKIYKSDLLPLITEIMDDFSWMVSDDAHAIQRCTVLRIFCYIFENCDRSATSDLMVQTTPRFIQCMVEEDCDVRQAAVYALGLLAEQCQPGSDFSSHVPTILQKCFYHFENQLEVNGYDSVLDNDASTIGKILKHHPESVPNISNVYQMWLQTCFPMREDKQEGEWCHQHFCELLRQQNTSFLGNNMSNLPKIVDAMADAYGTSLMTEDAEQYFNKLLVDLKSQNNQMLSSIIINLSRDNQTKVMQLVG